MAYIPRKNSVSRLNRQDYNSNGQTWKELVAEARKRDGNTCQSCGTSVGRIERHHIIPLSRGGQNSLKNITTLCEDCHSRRHRHLFTRLK